MEYQFNINTIRTLSDYLCYLFIHTGSIQRRQKVRSCNALL